MRIIISNEVKLAITDIFDYSRNISNNYASKIVNKIYDTIYNLQENPYIGRYVYELPNQQFREQICESYRIVYYVSEINNTIYVLYVFCSKRNSNLFFKVHKNELFRFLNQIFN